MIQFNFLIKTVSYRYLRTSTGNRSRYLPSFILMLGEEVTNFWIWNLKFCFLQNNILQQNVCSLRFERRSFAASSVAGK